MNQFPQEITNSFQNGQLNFSYAHAALQSLCFLESTNKLFSFMNNNGMRYNMLFPMANEFLNLIIFFIILNLAFFFSLNSSLFFSFLVIFFLGR